MQEGLLALMQVPRVIAAASRHAEDGLAHIGVLTDPTTGSAYAGFLSLADFIIAEPNALVGYAALRVLQESEGQRSAERRAHVGVALRSGPDRRCAVSGAAAGFAGAAARPRC